jgi:hypothetical protein
MGILADTLSGYPPGTHKDEKLTEAERLYLLFMFSKVPGEREDCRGRLAAICIKAVGQLTPPWQGRENGRYHRDFDSLRHKS